MSIPSVEYQAIAPLRYPFELRRPYYSASEELRRLLSAEKNAYTQWGASAIPIAYAIQVADDDPPIIRTPVVASILVEYNFVGRGKSLPPNIDEWQ